MIKNDILKAVFSAILFGLATPFSKILLNEDAHPVFLAALFYLGAALFLTPFSYKKFPKEFNYLKSNKKDSLRILGAVIFGGILGPVLLLIGIKMIDASSASLLLNFETVATTFLAFALFKEHIGKKVLLSSLITIAGGALLVFTIDFNINWGGVFIVLGCFCWGFDNNFTATVEGVSPQTNTIIKGFVAGLFNLTVAALFFEMTFSFKIIIISLIIGFLSYGLSIVLYIFSARNIGAARSQIIFAINPFVGSLLSFVFLNDILTGKYCVALGFMIVAIAILYYEKHDHSHVHEKLDHTHDHSHDDNHHDHFHSSEVVGKHVHEHSHKRSEHTHFHYPDVHHRHRH